MIDKSKKIILYYVVSEQHIINCINIIKLLPNYKFIIIYDKVIEKKILDKFDYNFYKLDEKIYEFIKINRFNIKIAILSTAQVRADPLLLMYNLLIFKINTLALQETHQFYLHNSEINNYILPTDNLFVCSKFEKEQFIKFGYNNENIKVVGWNFKISNEHNKNVINSSKRNILLLLNASNKINNISLESINLQINIINQIYKKFHSDFNLIVKTHPTENNLNLNKIQKSIDKNINIYSNQYSSQTLINKSDYIFCTGYSQTIFETIVLNKKIILIPIENKMKILNNLQSFNLDNLSYKEIKKLKNFNYNKIIKYNDLDLINNNYLEMFKLHFNNILKNKYNEINNLIELSLWLYYFKETYKSKTIFNLYKKNNKYNKEFDILYLFLFENLNLKDDELKSIYNKLQHNSFFVFKYIYIKKLHLKKEISTDIMKYLEKEEPKYLVNIFFRDFHFFLHHLILLNNKNYYNQLSELHIKNNRKIYNSKSKIFKIYLKFRYLLFYLNFIPFFSYINYKLYNFILKN